VLRLERRGDTFTGYVSPTGAEGSWKKVGAVEMGLGESYHVGLFGSFGSGGGNQGARLVVDELIVE
jgi:hypothetical protein